MLIIIIRYNVIHFQLKCSTDIQFKDWGITLLPLKICFLHQKICKKCVKANGIDQHLKKTIYTSDIKSSFTIVFEMLKLTVFFKVFPIYQPTAVVLDSQFLKETRSIIHNPSPDCFQPICFSLALHYHWLVDTGNSIR